ncbi:glycosyltransferase family 2 protein [Algoriphagus sp. D3-2-R+10]|uniref:glycosyltransferase family 2 protein n=1 Tax=Algoriphagus aurantiacus TaxID=3103948 RepID=UPI002B392BCD|nr:glycosyltransferase family 2 protein [Algoriphagus sp. D3-2-R+10]MEB2775205.1 glycosyltransferase family 2 protein [Algoriphagus sp. D3-2-R+10]
MKVSVIIPSYNYADYLAECLDSVLSQSWQDWEAWIIDDGSTDHTWEVAQNYQQKDPRIKYHYQENKGLSNARNTGLSLCNGELIQFLDADDLLSKDKLSLQVAQLEQHSEVAISYCQTWYFKSAAPDALYTDLTLKSNSAHPIIDGKGFEVLQLLIRSNFTTVSSPLIRKSIIEKGVIFPETVSNSEDWYFWLQCALKGNHFQFLSNSLAFTKIRVHGDSMSQQKLKMYYGELQLRNWLNEQIKQLSFSPEKKELLLILNQVQKEKLFKHVMLTGPLWDISHLTKMYQFSDLLQLLKYHKLAREHQKTIL